MKLIIVFIIFLVLMLCDKGLTYGVIKQIEKNPNVSDPIEVERNPLAKIFFRKLGLVFGTIVYGILSLITMFLAFFIFRHFFNEYIALYIVMMLFGLVIANNTFWLLNHAGVFK